MSGVESVVNVIPMLMIPAITSIRSNAKIKATIVPPNVRPCASELGNLMPGNLLCLYCAIDSPVFLK